MQVSTTCNGRALEKLQEQRLELRQEFERKDADIAESDAERKGKLNDLEEQYASNILKVLFKNVS